MKLASNQFIQSVEFNMMTSGFSTVANLKTESSINDLFKILTFYFKYCIEKKLLRKNDIFLSFKTKNNELNKLILEKLSKLI